MTRKRIKSSETDDEPCAITPQVFNSVNKKRVGLPSDKGLDDKLACGLSIREIKQMRHAGMDKPDIVTWNEWNSLEKFNHRHMLVCHLAALGYKDKDIAKATHFDLATIQRYLPMPTFQQQIKVIREVEMQGLGAQAHIKKLAAPAARLYEEILYDPAVKMSIRQKTAQDVLDRDMGKPLQKIENTGSLIKDLYGMLKLQNELTQKPATVDFAQPHPDILVESKPVEEKPEPVIIDADKWFKDSGI